MDFKQEIHKVGFQATQRFSPALIYFSFFFLSLSLLFKLALHHKFLLKSTELPCVTQVSGTFPLIAVTFFSRSMQKKENTPPPVWIFQRRNWPDRPRRREPIKRNVRWCNVPSKKCNTDNFGVRCLFFILFYFFGSCNLQLFWCCTSAPPPSFGVSQTCHSSYCSFYFWKCSGFVLFGTFFSYFFYFYFLFSF